MTPQAGEAATHAAAVSRHSGFFVLRTPLLPYSVVTDLSAGLEAAAAADAGTRRDALTRDRLRIRERLRGLVTTATIREALFVASPDLEGSIDLWLNSPDTGRGQAIERGLFRYIVRMASRPTPFGLFAGNSTGTVGPIARLTVDTPAACRRHTRLDMEYLAALAEALARDPLLAESLVFSPNSSLHRSADRWHYVESAAANEGRSHHLVAVEDSDALRLTLDRARHGSTRQALTDALVQDEVSEDDARAYVDELVASQILVPELECPVTGDEPIGCLIDTLRPRQGGAQTAERLAAVNAALEAIDAAPLGISPASYVDVAHSLEPFGVPIVPARLFQVDLVKPGAAPALSTAVVDELARGIEWLRRLTPKPIDDPLARLRAAFTARYQQREVALFDVLDEETGIASALGEGRDRDSSPLLDGISFPAPPEQTVAWTRREKGLLRRVGQLLANGGAELPLSNGDLDELGAEGALPLPPAYAVMATLISTPATLAAPRPDFRVWLRSVSGPSGASLLGRFCHGDPALADRVRAHIRAEEATDPDAVFAEIVHLPAGRVGNILARPVLREFEIVYLGRSGAPLDRRLPVDDLRLSIVNDRFVLRSSRLNRRVIPRLTSAHDYMAHSVAIYRFLCLLQAEGCASGLAWSWGPLEALPFLPRVTAGRLVFTRARWLVTADEISALRAATGVARYEGVQHWRKKRGVPRWVVLSEADTTMVVDLENAVSIDAMLQTVNERREIALVECYPGPDALCAEGPDGLFAHELVVPFTRDASPEAAITDVPAARSPAPVDITTRQMLPGSTWTYAQLFCGPAAADRLLAEHIGPLSRTLVGKGVADRWFFVRFSDPDHHVRWRLRATTRQAQTAIRKSVETLAADLRDRGLVHRVAFDTYEREIERYGGAQAADLAEDLFWIDSEAVLDIFAALAEHGAARDGRWQAAILGVDSLLGDLGLGVEARRAVMKRARAHWGAQLHVNAEVRREIARKYRTLQRDLVDLFERRFDRAGPLAAAAGVFDARSRRHHDVMARLGALIEGNALGIPMAVLAESYVHMHLNRLFRDEQNLHEVVIYDFLVQLYTRQLTRHNAG